MTGELKLKVFRKIAGFDERTYNYFKGTKDLVGDQYVWADGSWDGWATAELIQKTVGWAVGTPDGEILGEYKAGNDAYKAALGAKIDLKKSVELDDSPVIDQGYVEKPVEKGKKKA